MNVHLKSLNPMLNGRVLVLNQDYQPITVCSVQKSMVLLFLEKAELLHPNVHRRIHTVSTTFDFPSVIRLRRYARVPYKNLVVSRRNVLKRDGNRCQYCSKTEDLTIDHVLPKSRGGNDTWENLVTACNKCNHRKGNRTPHEAGMNLMRAPFKPNYLMMIRDFMGSVEDQWKPYLYM